MMKLTQEEAMEIIRQIKDTVLTDKYLIKFWSYDVNGKIELKFKKL